MSKSGFDSSQILRIRNINSQNWPTLFLLQMSLIDMKGSKAFDFKNFYKYLCKMIFFTIMLTSLFRTPWAWKREHVKHVMILMTLVSFGLLKRPTPLSVLFTFSPFYSVECNRTVIKLKGLFNLIFLISKK
jgi:hypothetical protein